MSLRSTIRKKPQVSLADERLRAAQQRVSDGAHKAAERIGPAAEQAREVAAGRVQDARQWSAPRLDQAADYVEKELGPKVSELLHRTAGAVEPAKPKRSKRTLAAGLLVVGGALGAAGAMAVRRKNAQQDETAPADLASVPATADKTGKPAADKAEANAKAH